MALISKARCCENCMHKKCTESWGGLDNVITCYKNRGVIARGSVCDYFQMR